MQTIEDIELYLRNLGVPETADLTHVRNVTQWRRSHIKVKRHRLECVFSADGHRLPIKPKRRRGRPPKPKYDDD